MKMTLNIMPVVRKLSKIRTLAVVVTVLAVAGYTAYQFSVAISVIPTSADLEAAKQKINPSAVKFDMPTIQSIVRHNSVKVSPDLGGLGTTNPFYGN